MKRLRNVLLYSGGFVLILMALMPKVNVYYFLEAQLKAYDVIIDSETVEDAVLQLQVSDGTVYVKKIEMAQVSQMSVGLFGLYNYIHVEHVQLDKTLEAMMPLTIESIHLSYGIWNPLMVSVDATGDFGTATASISLVDRTVEAIVSPSKMMHAYPSMMRQLKKDETGGYRYETRF